MKSAEQRVKRPKDLVKILSSQIDKAANKGDIRALVDLTDAWLKAYKAHAEEDLTKRVRKLEARQEKLKGGTT